MTIVTETRHAEWKVTDFVGSLRSAGGTCGGGSESLIILSLDEEEVVGDGVCDASDWSVQGVGTGICPQSKGLQGFDRPYSPRGGVRS